MKFENHSVELDDKLVAPTDIASPSIAAEVRALLRLVSVEVG